MPARSSNPSDLWCRIRASFLRFGGEDANRLDDGLGGGGRRIGRFLRVGGEHPHRLERLGGGRRPRRIVRDVHAAGAEEGEGEILLIAAVPEQTYSHIFIQQQETWNSRQGRFWDNAVNPICFGFCIEQRSKCPGRNRTRQRQCRFYDTIRVNGSRNPIDSEFSICNTVVGRDLKRFENRVSILGGLPDIERLSIRHGYQLWSRPNHGIRWIRRRQRR